MRAWRLGLGGARRGAVKESRRAATARYTAFTQRCKCLHMSLQSWNVGPVERCFLILTSAPSCWPGSLQRKTQLTHSQHNLRRISGFLGLNPLSLTTYHTWPSSNHLGSTHCPSMDQLPRNKRRLWNTAPAACPPTFSRLLYKQAHAGHHPIRKSMHRMLDRSPEWCLVCVQASHGLPIAACCCVFSAWPAHVLIK